jgi:hypothetical protein
MLPLPAGVSPFGRSSSLKRVGLRASCFNLDRGRPRVRLQTLASAGRGSCRMPRCATQRQCRLTEEPLPVTLPTSADDSAASRSSAMRRRPPLDGRLAESDESTRILAFDRKRTLSSCSRFVFPAPSTGATWVQSDLYPPATSAYALPRAHMPRGCALLFSERLSGRCVCRTRGGLSLAASS